MAGYSSHHRSFQIFRFLLTINVLPDFNVFPDYKQLARNSNYHRLFQMSCFLLTNVVVLLQLLPLDHKLLRNTDQKWLRIRIRNGYGSEILETYESEMAMDQKWLRIRNGHGSEMATESITDQKWLRTRNGYASEMATDQK